MRQSKSKAGRLATVAAILFIFSTLAAAQQAGSRRIVVSIPDKKLALIEDGEVVKIYRVATGRESSPTPTGSFTIVNRITSPTYYQLGKVIPPGKKNPVGARWIGLSKKHYAIHGTDEPRSIGRAASHGCVRMGAKDVKELFERVRIGDVVEIRGERDDEVARIFGGEPVVMAQAGGGR